MDKRLIEAVMTAIALGIVSFFFSIITSYFFGYNPTVSVGNVTPIANDQYIIPIDIQTYDKALKDFQIEIGSNINESQIKSNKPLNIEIVANNIGPTDGTNLKITQISKEQNVDLFIFTEVKIDKEEINIFSNQNNIDIVNGSESVNPLNKQIKSIILTAFIYAILIGLSTYFVNKNHDKRVNKQAAHVKAVQSELEKLEKNRNQQDKEINKFKEQFNEVKSELKEYQSDSLKKQILLQAKLNDYRKELNFWRNTIRKILYSNEEKFSKSDRLFEIVSSSLKTYQTNEKNKHDFESLKVLSHVIKDIDKE